MRPRTAEQLKPWSTNGKTFESISWAPRVPNSYRVLLKEDETCSCCNFIWHICGNKFQKCIYLTKTALFSVLFFYNADLNCFASHSILCLGLWISTTGKNKIHSLLESRSGRDCRHTDPHVKQTRWAGSSYRAGSSSQWKPCHTLIMHRFAKSACSQALACWTSSGSLAHQFCIFNTSDDSLHSDWEPWP